MRKGFSLVEILVVIMILPVVFVMLDGLFSTLLDAIPRSYRIAQENTTVLNMLENMRQDIDKAKSLPDSFGGQPASDELLLIGLADAVICYQLRDGQVLRRRLTETHENNAEETRLWSLPHAKVQWQVWRKDGIGYAVEVKTHIEHHPRGHQEKKMANSHLYFVGAF